MRRLRYQVACSLDGYIAGSHGEFDWIVDEPSFDFRALYDQFDTIIMGRGTFEVIKGEHDTFEGKRVYIVSSTLKQHEVLHYELIQNDVVSSVKALLAEEGKDIWLYGGGKLFSDLLAANLVDTVELAYIPVLLGGGIPLLAKNGVTKSLTLSKYTAYPSGMLLVEYSIKK